MSDKEFGKKYPNTYRIIYFDLPIIEQGKE